MTRTGKSIGLYHDFGRRCGDMSRPTPLTMLWQLCLLSFGSSAMWVSEDQGDPTSRGETQRSVASFDCLTNNILRRGGGLLPPACRFTGESPEPVGHEVGRPVSR